MAITPEEAQALKSAAADFAIRAAERREFESDVRWCTAQGQTPARALLDHLDEARARWRKAHKAVYGRIDELTEEAS